MRLRSARCVLGALLFGIATGAAAKPIAFAHGTTTMAEYGAGTMAELSLFHAPRYWWSFGGGVLELTGDHGRFERRIAYLRTNFLARRWNLPAAQANVFVWGGLGTARGSTFRGNELASHLGGQLDYETRRVYASLRTDFHRADTFAHRIDTLQLGLAPYEHEYDSLATWIVVQGRQYTQDLYEGTEWALLLRWFKGGAWLEAGWTADGHPQAMLMFNF